MFNPAPTAQLHSRETRQRATQLVPVQHPEVRHPGAAATNLESGPEATSRALDALKGDAMVDAIDLGSG